MSQVQNNLSRRMFLKLMGTGVASAALAACVAAPAAQSPSAASSGESAPAVEAASLSVMAFGEADQPAYAAIAEAFMARNGNIKVD